MTVRIDCWCRTCDVTIAEAQADNGDWLESLRARFIVCPGCGNKRCPRAWHHNNDCTGSNETGQIAMRNGVPVTGSGEINP